MKWENVYIFISSTFNDMHAERDYLVKKVFPQLSAWCEERRLRLVDIDLRWGVSEADATENKRVVQVCLNRIDECRPFFLCFLGQRRGWIPSDNDVSDETKTRFPKLIESKEQESVYLGKNSVTEMEILHALIDPMHNGTFLDKNGKETDGSKVKHAFFFLREPDYLNNLIHPDQRSVYTNKADPNPEIADRELNYWRDVIIPATGRPVIHYNADWNVNESTHEIALPLVVPTTAPFDSNTWKEAFKQWKRRWEEVGVAVGNNGEIIDFDELEKAKAYNAQLTKGRLSNFRQKGQSIDQIILKQLQDAITEQFGERVTEQFTPLQRELDQQEQFLQIASDGFIERGDDFTEINKYVSEEGENKPFALTAYAGMGKTSLLAYWISTYKPMPDETLHYRFIGGSDGSTNTERLLRSLLNELKEIGKINSDIPVDTDEVLNKLPDLLEEAGRAGKTILVIDALNQLESGMSELYWTLPRLPFNIKLIVSFKLGDADADRFYRERKNNHDMILSSVKPFANISDRTRLVTAYLEQYFKELDASRINTLVSSEGAENPLFLKVALSELRVYGVHNDLTQVIRERFGKTTVMAFTTILERMENDPAYTQLKPKIALPHIFGWIAHSRYGLTVKELSGLLIRKKLTNNIDESFDVIYLIIRQLRPFLARRDMRIDFFYESFKIAAKERYTNRHPYAQPAGGWHKDLAEYFSTLPLENHHKIMEQAYQYASSGMNKAYEDWIFNYFYIEACLSNFDTDKLIEDCSYSTSQNVTLLHGFYRLAATRLTQYPSLLAEELWGRMAGTDNDCFNHLLKQATEAKAQRKEAWLRPKFACLDRPGNEIVRIYRTDWIMNKQFALSPDNKRMITVVKSNQLSIWDVESGKTIRQIQLGDNYPECILYAPDGSCFAIIIRNLHAKKIKVWNALNYEMQCELQYELYDYCEKREGQLYSLTDAEFTFTSDSKAIIAKGKDGEIKISDTFTGKLISSITHLPETSSYVDQSIPEVYSFGVGGKSLIAMGCLHPDKNNKNWDQVWFKRRLYPVLLFDFIGETQQLIPRKYVLEGHDNTVSKVAVSPDEAMIASAQPGKVKLWNAATAELLGELSTDIAEITVLKFLDDGKELAVAGSDGILRIYASPELICKKSIPCQMGMIRSGIFFSDETHCLCHAYPNMIKLISLERQSVTDNLCSEKLISIGKDQIRNMFIASSYHNYIEGVGYQPTLFSTAEGCVYFFNADNNRCLYSKPLLSARNMDMVYVGLDGKFIVSKDCTTGNRTSAVFKYWPLEETLHEDEGFLADDFSFTNFHSGSSDWQVRNKYAQFSSDSKHLIITDSSPDEIVSVYKSKSGRLLNRIKWKKIHFSLYFKMLSNKMPQSLISVFLKRQKDHAYEETIFEVSSDGNKLYVLNLYTGLLNCFLLPQKKCIKTIILKEFLSDEYEYYGKENKLVLSEDENKLLAINDTFVWIIDIPEQKVIFRFNRKHKAGKDWGDSNCFASVNKDGSLLCISRAIYTGKALHSEAKDSDRDLNRMECIELWNTRQNKFIAMFYVEGHATNILVDDKQFSFGMSNGEICTLVLENYSIEA